MITNQIVTKDFIDATIEIIAQNTSLNYSVSAITGIKQQLGEKFKFLNYVHIKDGSIKVDKTINSVGKKELRKFFTKLIDLMGPNYLRLLLAKKLDPKELAYLENLGLRF